jgi:hypothetical protein
LERESAHDPKGFAKMFDYVGNFQSAIAALKREHRYRVIATIARLLPDCLVLSDALNHNSVWQKLDPPLGENDAQTVAAGG